MFISTYNFIIFDYSVVPDIENTPARYPRHILQSTAALNVHHTPLSPSNFPEFSHILVYCSYSCTEMVFFHTFYLFSHPQIKKPNGRLFFLDWSVLPIDQPNKTWQCYHNSKHSEKQLGENLQGKCCFCPASFSEVPFIIFK